MERTNHCVELALSKGCRVDRGRLLVEADGLCEYSSCRPILQTACLSLTTCSQLRRSALVRTSKRTLPTGTRFGLPELINELGLRPRIGATFADLCRDVSRNQRRGA